MRFLNPQPNAPTGLLADWPRGRLIAEWSGGFAKIALFFPPAALLVSMMFGGDPAAHWKSAATLMLWGCLVGTIWLALRRNSLRAAAVAVIINFWVLAIALLGIVANNFVQATSLDPAEGVVIYGVGSLCLVGLYLASREVRRRIATDGEREMR